jgi:hypothetical protein
MDLFQMVVEDQMDIHEVPHEESLKVILTIPETA